MATRWQVYPQSQPPTDVIRNIADVFKAQEAGIGTPPNKPRGDRVLAAVAPGLCALGFEVEASKTSKVKVPVLFGENGRALKSYEVDAWHREQGVVIEIEAGVAIDARKVYQDLFEAMTMPTVEVLCIAVQNAYHPPRRTVAFDDFARAKVIFDTLFASRVRLPLATVMLLGY